MWADQDFVGSNSNLILENGRPGSTIHSMGGDYLDTVAFNRGYPGVDNDMGTDWESWETIRRLRLSEKMTRMIYSYYVEGRRLRDIAIDEGVTSQAIDVRHNQAKMSVAKRLELESVWDKYAINLKYDSIEKYDCMVLFFKYHLPRRLIAKVVGINSSSKITALSNEINDLISNYLKKTFKN